MKNNGRSDIYLGDRCKSLWCLTHWGEECLPLLAAWGKLVPNGGGHRLPEMGTLERDQLGGGNIYSSFRHIMMSLEDVQKEISRRQLRKTGI